MDVFYPLSIDLIRNFLKYTYEYFLVISIHPAYSKSLGENSYRCLAESFKQYIQRYKYILDISGLVLLA